MAHNRKLVIGAVGLTRARIKTQLTIPAIDAARDELEKLMIETGFLEGAPFQWVSLIVREGLKNDVEPSYERISKKSGSLPVSIEVDVQNLLDASQVEMKLHYKKAALTAIEHLGFKYGLNTIEISQALDAMKSER